MAKTHLDELRRVRETPGGFAKLTTVQRKFLMGLVLAAIVPVDKRIGHVELEWRHLPLTSSPRLDESVALARPAMAEGQTDLGVSPDRIARLLPELLAMAELMAHMPACA